MNAATVADRRCYHRDDLKAEEYFAYLWPGRCTEQCAEALGRGSHALARCYGAVSPVFFPACRLAWAVLRNEPDDAERDLPLSFAFAVAQLWSEEYDNVCTKLSKPLQTQKLRPRGSHVNVPGTKAAGWVCDVRMEDEMACRAVGEGIYALCG
jgi:hypothetical protein